MVEPITPMPLSHPGARPTLPTIPERNTTPREHKNLGWLTLAALLIAGWIIAPVGVGLLLGTLTAFALQPLHRRLLSYAPRHPALIALATTLIATLAGAASAGALGYLVVSKVLTGLQAVVEYLRTRGTHDLLGPRLGHSLLRFGITPQYINGRLDRLLDAATSHVTMYLGFIVGIAVELLAVILFLVVTTYYALQEWPRLVVRVERLLPFNPRHSRALLVEFRDVGRSALLGTVITGLVQGLTATMGYAMTGVPQPVFWGAVTFLTSLLPAIGTMLVWLPVGLWLSAQGHLGAGLAEVAWNIAVTYGLCDYVLRPRLVGRQGKMHPLLVLVSLLGGVEVFGGIGVILGPVVMALFIAVVRIYEREKAGTTPLL